MKESFSQSEALPRSGKRNVIISEFMQHDGRKKRTAKCLCWQGYYLHVLLWSLLNILMFSALLQNNMFKERWSLRQNYFKQNYCHACHTRFAVLFDLLFCCISSPWNFCTRYSKVILQENQWWCCTVKCLLFFRLQFINITPFLITEREVLKDLGLVLSE